MSKIVYLLGAGASYGDRGKDKDGNIVEMNIHGKRTSTGSVPVIGKCANIKEGLPLVSEIPGRLAYVINEIKNCPCSQDIVNSIFPLGATGGTGFNKAREILLNDLKWLKDESEKHATIDTFAKKLFLKGQLTDFYKVESLLSVFFIIEQITNKKDGRYDTFLASVLDSNLNIDGRITILTWNYDSQFELAYKEYGEAKEASGIRRKLGIADLKDQSYETRNQIFKLNGTANFLEQIDLTQYNKLNSSLLVKLIDLYLKGRESKGASRISFAWDNKEYIEKNFETALINAIKDAKILVVIGYTFPFFNREIDRAIFSAMNTLENIYIQDPNATQIIDNLESLYTPAHTGITHVNRKVKPITNTSQFYLPPEL